MLISLFGCKNCRNIGYKVRDLHFGFAYSDGLPLLNAFGNEMVRVAMPPSVDETTPAVSPIMHLIKFVKSSDAKATTRMNAST